MCTIQYQSDNTRNPDISFPQIFVGSSGQNCSAGFADFDPVGSHALEGKAGKQAIGLISLI
jgi:hypothetical protein